MYIQRENRKIKVEKSVAVGWEIINFESAFRDKLIKSAFESINHYWNIPVTVREINTFAWILTAGF